MRHRCESTKAVTLARWISRKIEPVKPGTDPDAGTAVSPDVCPVCVAEARAEHRVTRRGTRTYSRAALPLLRAERYARDYVVRCCLRCGRCFWYDSGNKRHVELCFSYQEFFGGDEDE